MKMTFTQMIKILCRILPVGVLLGLVLIPQWAKAQCDPRTSCISQVQVTMDANCKFTVTPNLVGFGDCVGTYRVVVSDSNPSNGAIIDCPGLWDYAVLNTANEVLCWGKILAEDKSGPILESTDFINTTLWCTDVDFVLNNPKTVGPTATNQSLNGLISGSIIDTDVKNLGIPNFADNCKSCGCNITLKFSDRLETANCTETIVNGVYARIRRVFVATDCRGMTQSVEQVITFRRPVLNDFKFDFAGDANHKAIISYDACAANKNQIRRIDVVPYLINYFEKKIYLDTLTCGYGLNTSDIEFPICGSTGLKIERTLKLYDWCLNREVAQYKILIKLGDTSPPRIIKLSRIPVVSTGPSDCTAVLPTTATGLRTILGTTISDNCNLGTLSLRVRTKGRIVSGIIVDTTNWYNMNYPVSNGVITGVTVGRHRLIITANDGCYNSVVDSVEFFVKDLIAPVMKCDDKLRVSLSNTPGLQTGYGKVTAQDIDEGSWDNCSRLRWMRVRRVIPAGCEATFIGGGYDVNGNGKIDALSFDNTAPKNQWPIGDADFLNSDGSQKYDGIDLNGDGDLDDVGETFVIKEGKLLSPLGDYMEFFCCDLGALVTVELWGEDLAGNRNYCWMNLLIEDKTAPICTAPWPETVYCTDKCLGQLEDRVASSVCFGDVNIQGGNDCTNLNIQYTVVNKVKCGKGTITRRWTILKGSQSTSCEQIITVLPINEYDICFPRDATANCKTVSADSAFAVELGCDALAVNVSDKRYDAGGGECYKIFRTYTIINWCTYDDRCGDPMDARNVYVVDRGKFQNQGKNPVYVLVRDREYKVKMSGRFYADNGNNQSFTKDGDEEFWLSLDRTVGNSTRVDNINYADELINSDLTKCTASNEYPHSFMYTQIIKVEDPQIPVVTIPQLTVFQTRATDCLADVTITFRGTDNCSASVELEIPQLMVAPNQTLSGPFIMYSSTRWTTKANADGSFTVTVKNLPEGKHDLIVLIRDGCGNLSKATRIPFEVRDRKAPAPICIKGLSLSLMSDQQGGGTMAVWATDFVASPIYDCNGQGETNAQGLKKVTKYSINRKGTAVNVANTGLVLTCADKGKAIEVEIHAWDEAGNHDFCLTFVEVQDNNKVCPGGIVEPITISGYVATSKNAMMKGVPVQLSGDVVKMNTSGSDGTYNFLGLSKGKNYTLTPDMNKDFGNGISTMDLLVLQKHLINAEPITNPYLLIAADVDNSGHVSVGDQIRLRKFILNMIPDFGGTKSWCFVDQAYRFPDPLNPWKEAFPQTIAMPNLDHDVKANFVGIKVGDLNQSATVNAFQVPELRSGENLMLEMKNLDLEAGNTYELPVHVADLSKISGYQFALDLDIKALEFVGILDGVAKLGNFGIFAERGILTTSWIDEGRSKNGALFTLVVKAKTDVQLSKALQINPQVMNAEAYNRENEVIGLALSFGDNTSGINQDRGLVLEQNQPNPFRAEAQIGFWLPQTGEATLNIYDVTGRVVKSFRQSFDRGYNQLLVKHTDLPADGVYYYTLMQNGATATRKMIVTK